MADVATWRRRLAATRASGPAAACCDGRGMGVRAQRNCAQRCPAEPTRTAMVRIARVDRRPHRLRQALIVEIGVARIRVEPGSGRATLAAIVDVLGGARPS